MKDNKFFNEMCNKIKEDLRVSVGELNAFDAWEKGIEENQDFPIQIDTLWKKDRSDFLKTIKAAGFKKFGFSGSSTMAMENLVDFVKDGWQVTGTFKYDISNFDGYRFSEGVILERRD